MVARYAGAYSTLQDLSLLLRMSPIWHPYTQAKTAPPPLKVKSAQGIWLELDDGSRLMDCISSWWVTLHGHAHPAIATAIFEQANRLEQVILLDSLTTQQSS